MSNPCLFVCLYLCMYVCLFVCFCTRVFNAGDDTVTSTSSPASSASASAAASASPVPPVTTSPVPSLTKDCSCIKTRCCAPGVATYNVTFSTAWPQDTYNRPPNGHFSPISVASHSPCTVLYRHNTTVGPGIKQIAETGRRQIFEAEVIAAGDHIGQLTLSYKLLFLPSSESFFVTVDQFHPLVSAVSMIGPSPDWIVGLDSVSMCSDKRWVKSVDYNLYAFDAGTDSAPTYVHTDTPSAKKDVVKEILPSSGTDVFVGDSSSEPFATLKFELVRVRAGNPRPKPDCEQCTVEQAMSTCQVESWDGKH